jgi:hypothetical protein
MHHHVCNEGEEIKMRNKIIITTIFLMLLAGFAYGDVPNVKYVSVRALGMGGPGITTMTDFSALMYNPAQLAKCDFHLDILNIQARMGKDVVDMFNFYQDNQKIFDDMEDASEADQNKIYDGLAPFDDKWIGFGGYPTVGFSMHNFALGFYAAADADVKTDLGIMEPRAYLHGVGDYVFSAGIAFKMPDVTRLGFFNNNFYGGAAIKIITRYYVDDLRMKASNIDFDEVYDTLITSKETGFGVDLGLVYDFIPEKVSFGLRVNDIVAKIGDEKPATLFNVGASWQFTKNLLLAADYRDIFFNHKDNIFNRLNMGAEYSLAKFLYLRGGIGQGYPSFGLGLNFGNIFVLDGAIYGVEKTTSPGGEGSYNYAVRLKLGI